MHRLQFSVAATVATALLFAAGQAEAQSTSCAAINSFSGEFLQPTSLAPQTTAAALAAGEWYSLRVRFDAPGANLFSIEVEEAGPPDPNFNGTLTTAGLLTYQVVTGAQSATRSSQGSASDAYLKLTCQFAAAAVTSLAASSGPTAGGTSVVITGTNLGGATAVNFGGTPATSFTVDSNSQVTAVSPASAAGTVDVQVLAANGNSVTSGSGDNFTYNAPPPIPTLTEWAMILMGAVLAGLGALTVLRRRRFA
ncbi:MAG: IPT/TIG domain-containing protein [Brevundimonas sp.]|uniref:IPT/TIG domain-containing protein n=1 Tax=Brevundimonas sp. TaxID=1871086 RepID=UPI0040347E3C